MSARVEAGGSEHRAWWVRALLVLQAPRSVFVAVREDSPESLEARQEPITALVILAGIAWVLSSGAAGTLLDAGGYDGVVIAIWAFIVGSLFGLASYWVLGAALHVAARGFGSVGTYRRARHIVGFAAAPIALSLVLVPPLRLALYGGDVFRRGGADEGSLARALEILEFAFVAWAAALLVIGVRAVHGWTWARAAACVGAAVVALALVTSVVLPLVQGG